MTADTNRRAHQGRRLTHFQMKLAVIATLAVNATALLTALLAGAWH